MHVAFFSFRPIRQFVFLLTASLLIFSCSDDDTVGPDVSPPGRDGYFIVNEGGFDKGNTSLSYYDRTRDTVLNNVFEFTNGPKLGDQSQSMTVIGDRGFIVVQNSSKIEVINRDDFTSIATITEGIISPRYLIGVDDTKAYVTDWGADGVTGTVKVINLASYEVTKTIPVGQGPNGMLVYNNQVYVANNGGFSHDSTVMILDIQTDAVVDTLIIGTNPESFVIDTNRKIWVAGSGRTAFDRQDETPSLPGFIARLEADTVAIRIDADQAGFNAFKAVIDSQGQQLYFIYGEGVRRLRIGDTTFPSTPFIPGNFYALGVDPVTDEILTGDPLQFTSEGAFFRYSPQGQIVKSYTVGIAPNGFAF